MNTKALRQKILDLAIRGKLVAQDPNDEPASVLLERISAEKERLLSEGKIKRPKKAASSDTPHYQNVPQGWTVCRLDDICSIKGGKRIPRGQTFSTNKTEHIYLRVSDMKNGTIVMSDLKYIDEDVFQQIRSYTINSTDLYLTIAGTIGAVGIIPQEVDGMNLTENAAKLTDIACVKEYLLYALQSSSAQEHFISRFHQVAQPKLSIETASSTLIYLPPLAEQQRIVAEIEKWFGWIDKIEENQADLATLVEQAKGKILDLAIHGKLVAQDESDEPALNLLHRINPDFQPSDTSRYENLPSGWQVTELGRLCQLNNGEKETGRRIYLDAKYLRGKADGTFLTEGNLVAKGDYVILVDGENSGEVFVAPQDGYMGSTFKRLIMADGMYCPYVLFFIMFYKKTLRNSKKGAAIPHLNKDLFRSLEIGVPPYAEQQRIVAKIERLFAALDDISQSLL